MVKNFEYQGRDTTGKLVKGKIIADDSSGAAANLFKKNIIPIKITEVKEKDQTVEVLFSRILKPKIPLGEMIIFGRQMYTLTKAGIPIINAFMRLSETSRNKAFSMILQAIVRDVSAGRSLVGAMSKHPHVFSPLLLSIIRVGESTGALDESFLQIAQYLELEERTFKQVKAAMRYPIIVVVAITIALVVINIFVIPAFADIFAQNKQELPLATRFLLASSNFMLTNGVSLLIGFVGSFILFRYYISTKNGRYNWHRFILKIPIVGSILTRIMLTRFARAFAMVTKAGVPLSEGIALTGRAVGNDFAAAKIIDMQGNIARGTSVTKSAAKTKLFSPLVIQMLAVGEESGSMDTMLQEIAGFYEREVDYDLKTVGDSIEPILLAFVGVMVLILALGVFLPMWQMATFAG